MATNVGAKKRAGIALIVVGLILIATPFLGGGEPGDRVNAAKALTVVAGGLAVLGGAAMTRKKGHHSEPPPSWRKS